MKEMNNTEKFTEKEWEELASILSDEKSGRSDLMTSFTEDDYKKTGDQWKEIKDMNSQKEIDVDKAWSNVLSMMNKAGLTREAGDTRIITMRQTFLRVAAVALILISAGTSVFYLYNSGALSKKIVYSTGKDQKNLLIGLADGSRIFLNRNSELTCRENFGKTSRNVTLSGEAFFEITADASKPFIIDAGNAKVQVVGTSFNVITSNKESAVEVFVKTGKVILSDNSDSESLLIDPGYIGKIASSRAEKIVNKDINYLSWNTGLLLYNGQTLDVVFSDLKRVYDMDILADDSTILENRWTSPIDNQSRETIIRLICTSFNLSYTLDGNVYHLVKK